MFLIALYLLTVLLTVFGDNDTKCASGFRKADSDSPINVTEICNERSPCIGKCCPLNQILVLNNSDNILSCVDNKNLTHTYESFKLTDLDDYSEIEFYKNNIDQNIIKSSKKMEQFIQIFSDDFHNDSCFMDANVVFVLPEYKIYLLENGSLVMRHLNSFKQWIFKLLPNEFCVDRQIELNNGTVSMPEFVIRMMASDDGDEDSPAIKTKIATVGFLVSCVFLGMVLAVYALLPRLRNLAGMILMAYVATLITALVLRAVQILATDPENEDLTKETCIWLGLMVIYTLVASFTWMNVMSFDIWWSMRGFRKLRQTHRRGLLMKLGWYALYGWGVPLALLVFMIIVENLDLSEWPNFVKSQYSRPGKCFIEDELMLYLHSPILIAICINIILFLMTAYNIWRIRRSVSQHSVRDSSTNKKDETRFGIYLKLSFVMGINWILELASTFCDPESRWWYATDVFNSLIGLCIFIIFICKRSIIVLLCKRFSIGEELVRKWQPAAATESSRLNSRYSRKKMLDSVTDTSDIYNQEKCTK